MRSRQYRVRSCDQSCDYRAVIFFRCTVITNDGYFVLLPDGTVPPLHITEHSDVSIGYDLCTCAFHFLSPLSLPQYNGITLFMITNSILVKTACNNLDNFAINHERFYYVRKDYYFVLNNFSPSLSSD